MKSYPRLVSDIGGTNARFALEVSPYKYEEIRIFECKTYPKLSDAIKSYLNIVEHKFGKVSSAALAVPSPIIDDTLFMVNSPWHLSSISQTKADTGLEHIIFLNDFHALALAVPHIPKANLLKINNGNPLKNKPMAIIGPGTGLGMATLIKHPINEEYFAIPAEGGRSSFTAVNEEEFEIWKFIHRRFNHVSIERLISGPGLQLIYEAICYINKININDYLPKPHEITELGVNNKCFICKQTVDHFCRILGTIASNLACITNSFGGVYIGGGIIPKIQNYFIQSDFKTRFEDKGRYRTFLEKMPIYIITDSYPAVYGSSYALDTFIHKNYIP